MGAMKIGGSWENTKWPALRARLESTDKMVADAAWKEAVDVLEDRLGGRYLNHASELLKRPYSGFAALALHCAVVEAFEQFRQGKPRSAKVVESFTTFLTKTSFAFTVQEAETFYDTVRNGIFHQAETKEDTTVNRKSWEQAILEPVPSGYGFKVNALRFHERLLAVFADYKKSLIDGDPTLRTNFISKMEHVCRPPQGQPSVGVIQPTIGTGTTT